MKMKNIKILTAAACVLSLVASARAVTLSWDDISDTPDANGATSYLTATGFTGGTQYILDGHEGSIYFDFQWVSSSDVPAVSGIQVFLVEPGTTDTVSDWAYIYSLDKQVVTAGQWQYTISGFFQSDSPGNGMPTNVQAGYTGILETGTSQNITGNYQYQDFSGPPYPIVTAVLPSDLSIFVTSSVDSASVPDTGSTLMLLALSLGALVFGSRWVRRPVPQRS